VTNGKGGTRGRRKWAFIERRFLTTQEPLHLTLRDQYANSLQDLFDFNHSPSLNTALTQAQPPAVDCSP